MSSADGLGHAAPEDVATHSGRGVFPWDLNGDVQWEDHHCRSYNGVISWDLNGEHGFLVFFFLMGFEWGKEHGNMGISWFFSMGKEDGNIIVIGLYFVAIILTCFSWFLRFCLTILCDFAMGPQGIST